jgi:N-acyl-D-amino-acid deacylase
MAEFDLVLRNGVLHDGTGANPMRGDVGILGDRIAAIGAPLRGRQVLDCTGLCVAPGFVNVRSHSDLEALAEPTLPSKVRQGITLEVVGHDGLGPAPLRAGDVENRRGKLGRRLFGDIDWGFRSVASYLDALDQARPTIDLAYLVPHGAVRDSVVGVAEPAAPHDLFRMKGLLARSLDEGAFGLSLLLPGDGSAASAFEELSELASVVGARELRLVGHPRHGGARLLDSLSELFAVGRECGAHVHVSGLSVRGAGGRSLVEGVATAFAAAHRLGVKATADVSPSTFRLAPLSDLLPPWVLDGGRAALRACLADAQGQQDLRRRLLADLTLDPLLARRPEAIRLFGLPAGRGRDLCGRALDEAAGSRDPLLFALDLLAEAPHDTTVVPGDLEEAALDELIGLPFVTWSAADIPGGGEQFPRALARCGREPRSLPLASAVRKMTGQPAETFGLDDHGYLLAGRRANAVVFDAQRLRDPAALEPARATPAIRHVLVGGKLVLLDGSPTGERPGRVVRRKKR